MTREFLNHCADCCDTPDWDTDAIDEYPFHLTGEYHCTACGMEACVRFSRDSYEVYDP